VKDESGHLGPKDEDEINRREVCECDGRVCDLEDVGVPSIITLIRKVSVLVRMSPTFDLRCEEDTVRRKWKSPLVGHLIVYVYYETIK
jgi:hypothetical protein